MAVYKLTNGYRVYTTPIEGDKTEFETRNADREIISTVTLPKEEAAELITMLRINDGIRFAQCYGGQII